MASVKCFFIRRTDRVQLSIRRYGVWGKRCESPRGYHDASVVIGEDDIENHKSDEHDGRYIQSRLHVPNTDPRWPVKCAACDYVFTDEDARQRNVNPIYEGPTQSSNGYPGVFRGTLDEAPAGAMWDAWWYGEHYRGPDGVHLVVRTPGGDWTVDGPMNNGAGWTRFGEIPNVTATPSIAIRDREDKERYHAWLKNGELVEC